MPKKNVLFICFKIITLIYILAYVKRGPPPPSQKLQIGHKNNDKLFFFRIKVTKLVCCVPIAYSMHSLLTASRT